jgi:hypothetical protein
MSTPVADYNAILTLVRSWPAAQRLTLVQDVLGTLAPPQREPQQTLAQARGLLATTAPAPSDQQIETWLDERRAERYGV